MAVIKTILKNTNQETVIKVSGTAGVATINLATDLLAATQALAGGVQTVNIATVQWVGLSAATITITRNAVNVLTLPGGGADYLEFAEGAGFVESTENTSNISVTIAGAEAQCYLVLRKVSGYATKVETAVFGAYDDQTQVGS